MPRHWCARLAKLLLAMCPSRWLHGAHPKIAPFALCAVAQATPHATPIDGCRYPDLHHVQQSIPPLSSDFRRGGHLRLQITTLSFIVYLLQLGAAPSRPCADETSLPELELTAALHDAQTAYTSEFPCPSLFSANVIAVIVKVFLRLRWSTLRKPYRSLVNAFADHSSK